MDAGTTQSTENNANNRVGSQEKKMHRQCVSCQSTVRSQIGAYPGVKGQKRQKQEMYLYVPRTVVDNAMNG
jgi:hypothetical protein